MKNVVPILLTTDPEDFVPKISILSGKYESWGINDYGERNKDGTFGTGLPLPHVRKMSAQTYYANTETPQVQFIKHLMSRKEAQLAARDDSDHVKRDYILKIGMGDGPYSGVVGRDGKELIWRRIKVSGGTKLSTFQDKILQPVMGWYVSGFL